MVPVLNILTGIFILSGQPVHCFIAIRPCAPKIPTNTLSIQPSKRLQVCIHQTESKHESYSNVKPNLTSKVHRALFPIALALTVLLSPLQLQLIPDNHHIQSHTPMAWAADYGSLTDEQKAVAEAWRIVDNNFIDRTFNHQDWFKLRQDFVKKKYKTMDEANSAIESLVSSLGDKYTRYLPLNKYKSIVDAATGTLAGIGVELSTDTTNQRVVVSDVEANSPASLGMLFVLLHYFEYGYFPSKSIIWVI